MDRAKKKRLILSAVAVFLAVIILAATVFLCLNPQYPFIAGEFFGVRCKNTELSKVEPSGLDSVTLGALSADERVRFEESLMLVNTDFTLADDFAPDIVNYNDTGVQMNVCMTEHYASLSAAVKEKTGERLLVSSDFRTSEQQQEEFESAPAVATKPGASEHQTGLALDVYVPYYASYGFLKTEAGRFVNSECWKYGFIIRYPVFGEKETGIVFEPWHIRYVGFPHAKIIYNDHLTLEEYLASLEVGAWYEAEGYLISRQSSPDGSLFIPSEFKEAVISPDNMGGYVVTVSK